MARRGSTEVIRVAYVATIADTSAPTVAELTAGVNLTPFMLRNGLSTPQTGSTVDTSDAASRQNTQAAGTYGGDNWSYRGYRDDGTDTAWDTLEPGTEGFLVIRRFGGSDAAFAAADKVEVAPIEVVSRSMNDTADNESQNFTASLAVTGQVKTDAVVAGP